MIYLPTYLFIHNVHLYSTDDIQIHNLYVNGEDRSVASYCKPEPFLDCDFKQSFLQVLRKKKRILIGEEAGGYTIP